MKILKSIFKGPPSQQDLEYYRNVYYRSVEDKTFEIAGNSATTKDDVKSMHLHGNAWFIDSFPDVYKPKEELGSLYEKSFKTYSVNNNIYANTHIRSRSEHTPDGENLLLPD
jgi:hypothetical protein